MTRAFSLGRPVRARCQRITDFEVEAGSGGRPRNAHGAAQALDLHEWRRRLFDLYHEGILGPKTRHAFERALERIFHGKIRRTRTTREIDGARPGRTAIELSA